MEKKRRNCDIYSGGIAGNLNATGFDAALPLGSCQRSEDRVRAQSPVRRCEMKNREAELQMQIEQVIGRLQKIQRYIAGSRQPATRIELERLQELGRSYEQLQRQLQDWYRVAPAAGVAGDERS